jgi:D-alanyl-D-alanine carboxypeptidase
MYLTTGEVYTLKELLYGLLLNSGNDAAYAIADGVAGDTSTFVEWMNIKAKEIGLENTEFKDPSGLDDNTYSTAQDLIKLSRYAMKHDLFREIVKTYNIELTSDTHKYVYLENATNLLTSYPGVAGVKTGYTEEAGLCLVTYASNNGHEIMGVVLKSIDRKGDMILMLDHGFGTLGVEVHHNLL